MNDETSPRSNDPRRSDLDVPMPGSGMGLDRDIDRDFTPEEARRALIGPDESGNSGHRADDAEQESDAR